MSFLEDLNAVPPVNTKGCAVVAWLEGQTLEVAAEFGVALADDERYPATVLLKVMKAKYGYTHGVDTIRRHRRGECCS